MRRSCSLLSRPCRRPHDLPTAPPVRACAASHTSPLLLLVLPDANLPGQGCRRLAPRTSRRSLTTTRILASAAPTEEPASPQKQGGQARGDRKHGGKHGNLLTLAIESSCDDTCVAILERDAISTTGDAGSSGGATLHFNDKVTADSRDFKGVYPDVAVQSHVASMAPLLKRALRALPRCGESGSSVGRSDEGGLGDKTVWVDGRARRKPDFVSVTRGPGMMSNLTVGLMTAKSLAVAWDVPLLAVNHMEAHALTPRLVHALEKKKQQQQGQQQRLSPQEQTAVATEPDFPFISVLVSGGHSLLVHSRGLNDHAILAQADNIAIGDLLDKCARLILPEEYLAAATDVMYGRLLEEFAFPRPQQEQQHSSLSPPKEYDYGYTPPQTRPDEQRIYTSPCRRAWWLTPPMHGSAAMRYDFSGLNGRVKTIVTDEHPDLGLDERRELARHTMRLAFEHLASRLVMALKRIRKDEALAAAQQDGGHHASGSTTSTTSINTVVLSGGVASNAYLRHILRAILDVRGFPHVKLIFPPVALCTDNAAMIAWTGMEMYTAGWRSALDVKPIKKWPLDPAGAGGGILGAQGWYRDD
ncbi:glycoprotease family-domain-containing protein [Microdochium trichocladiopsis]|uniref:Glycoprotease family-domain-containing protein n=1 Tax=Microdochium trichocladiopsis TaxID=1682393 RepID=A0A9P8Y9P6_9PEZI|nr:glycoprotease family-domain-containing protein [Microdochium trichocladiopsis]KAH7031349.1 glycoprotease family-domain-containing protein [Microdochium trichocladiopsis]